MFCFLIHVLPLLQQRMDCCWIDAGFLTFLAGKCLCIFLLYDISAEITSVLRKKEPVKTLGIAVDDQFLCFLCDFSQLLRLF